MIKITKKDKNEFNKTKDGNYYNQLKNKGLIMLVICLIFTIIWITLNTSEMLEDVGLLIIFILGTIGAFPIGLYYGKLYRFILDKMNN